MTELRDEERVRHLGVSNFPPWWLADASSKAPLVCDQFEYHPLLSQDRLLERVRERDMALVAYSPLAHGRVMESDLSYEELARIHSLAEREEERTVDPDFAPHWERRDG